jgi:hypothetical protein
MARLFKPTIIRYSDLQGRRCKKGDPGALKKRAKSKTWRGEYRDGNNILQPVTLFTDKEASRQKLHELERKAMREQAGLVNPFEEHDKRPLSQHLVDFEQNLRDGGKTDDYCRLKAGRARRIIDGCGFRYIRDISASQVQANHPLAGQGSADG